MIITIFFPSYLLVQTMLWAGKRRWGYTKLGRNAQKK